MFEKKKTAEIIYSYPADSDIVFFQVYKIVGEEYYLAHVQESIMFKELDYAEKFLTHMNLNFEYFINNNFDVKKLKQEILLTKLKEDILGESFFYNFRKNDNNYFLELETDMETENIIYLLDWITKTVDQVKKDIKKYKERKVETKAILNIVGASGSGKTTIGNYLKSKNIPELVSYTTRQMREGEVEGNPYYFVSEEEFNKLEKIQKTIYSNNYYCISKQEVDNKLKDNKYTYVITAIDGAKQIQENCNANVVVIYIKTNLEIMRQRMLERGDSEENIQKRLQYAIDTKELENAKYADIIIDNTNDFEVTKKQLDEILNI